MKGEGARQPTPADQAWRRFLRSRLGRCVLAVVMLLAIAIALDGVRAPKDQVGVKVALAAIGGYQATASPLLGRLGVACRFEPTCSHYGRAAIEHRGLVPGAWLTAKRVARCGPWTPAGTEDPPPGPR